MAAASRQNHLQSRRRSTCVSAFRARTAPPVPMRPVATRAAVSPVLHHRERASAICLSSAAFASATSARHPGAQGKSRRNVGCGRLALEWFGEFGNLHDRDRAAQDRCCRISLGYPRFLRFLKFQLDRRHPACHELFRWRLSAASSGSPVHASRSASRRDRLIALFCHLVDGLHHHHVADNQLIRPRRPHQPRAAHRRPAADARADDLRDRRCRPDCRPRCCRHRSQVAEARWAVVVVAQNAAPIGSFTAAGANLAFSPPFSAQIRHEPSRPVGVGDGAVMRGGKAAEAILTVGCPARDCFARFAMTQLQFRSFNGDRAKKSRCADPHAPHGADPVGRQ